MKTAKWLGLALGTLILGACAHSRNSVTEIEYPMALEGAQRAYAAHDYKRVESSVAGYLTSGRDQYWMGHAYLLLGQSREAAGDPTAALDAYKKALTQGVGYDQKVMGLALYRASWIYEKQKNYSQMILMLIDLQNVLLEDDEFLKNIEIPSRLAAAYYMENMWPKALAARNSVTMLSVAQAQNSPQAKNLYRAQLYRSFVMLGENPQVDKNMVFALVQKDLLDAGEMGDSESAAIALNALKSYYAESWNGIKAKKKFPKVEAQRTYNKGKLEELSSFTDSIQELRSLRRPPEVIKNLQMNTDFFNYLLGLEKEARAYAQGLEMGVQKWKKK